MPPRWRRCARSTPPRWTQCSAVIGETAGETIALRLGEMEERIGHQAATAAARILGSFLSDELQKRSMESLAQSIRAAVEERETFRIDIRGPQSLFEALQTALGDQAGNFGYRRGAGLRPLRHHRQQSV